MCGGNKASALEGKAELCVFGTLQQPPCPAACPAPCPAPCSHFRLPCCCPCPSWLFVAGIVSILTHTATAPNGTAPRRPVGAVLTQTSVSFLPAALRGSAKPHLVHLCSPEGLQVWCFTHDQVPTPFRICPLQKHHPTISALWHFAQNAGGESNFRLYLRHDTDA